MRLVPDGYIKRTTSTIPFGYEFVEFFKTVMSDGLDGSLATADTIPTINKAKTKSNDKTKSTQTNQ